ncbi:uncharacterized protein LOC112690178 [Sipha flava]|uniref:Uncharacterized protein LOC112690178 n=1 Tax=Sipha flava TaxID=143950 RepID=A0A8B8GBC1_9HEMI|nr:uncharacterized protein LOC112690178 [Sipha flava]XP_025419911.1 uncharacterized protein LOC112690178 [Sipha flava]
MLRTVHCLKGSVMMLRCFPWLSTPHHSLQLTGHRRPTDVDVWTCRTWTLDTKGKKTQCHDETVWKETMCDKSDGTAQKTIVYENSEIPCYGAATTGKDKFKDSNKYGPFDTVVHYLYSKEIKDFLVAFKTFDYQKIKEIPNGPFWMAFATVGPLMLRTTVVVATLSPGDYSLNVMIYMLAYVSIAKGWLLATTGDPSQFASFSRFSTAIAPIAVSGIAAAVAPTPVALLIVWWTTLDVATKLSNLDGTQLQQSPPPPWFRQLVVLVFQVCTASMVLALPSAIFH